MINEARADTVTRIADCGIVAVIRMQDRSRVRAVVDALAAGGITALEVTMTVPGAIDLIGQLAPTLPRGFVLGAGTILDAETARLAILSGAQFIVGPVFRPEVVAMCHRYDIAAMPGCFTPTEILAAWEAGADVVKVFPATAPAAIQLPALSSETPPVGIIFTCGRGPRTSLKNPGPSAVAGKTFTTSAPASQAARISVGVKQPGMAAMS